MDTVLTVWGVYWQRWGGVRWEEGALFNNQKWHEAAMEGSRGREIGGMWDAAIYRVHRRVGKRTSGLSVNLGLRCTVWSTAGADDDDKDDQRPCLYPEVLPMQITMKIMTSFYDATTNLTVRCIPGRGEWGVISTMMTMTLMTAIRTTT